MKKLTPYLINKKALQFVMAALLLLGGSRMAWGQITIDWSNGNAYPSTAVNIPGVGPASLSTIGDGADVVIEIEGTVYIDGPIRIIDRWVSAAIAGNHTVTIQPKAPATTCTIKRASGYTGEMFIIQGTGFQGSDYLAGGHLVINQGVTFDGENRANCSSFITVYTDYYYTNSPLFNGDCKIYGDASNKVYFKNNTTSAITNLYRTRLDNETYNLYGLIAMYAEFSGNSAEDGGAINSRGPIYLNLCTFTGNTATGAGVNHGNGGCIHLSHFEDYNTSHIYNSTFSNNTANNDGGVMYFSYKEIHSKVDFTGCNFTGNSAVREGGVFQNIGKLDCTSCSFSNNHAAIGGVLMHTAYNNPSLRESTYVSCSFTGNYATNIGGAIKSNWALVLSGCSFDQNYSVNDGGAIYNAGNMLVSDNELGTHSTFTRNYSSNGHGGAIADVGILIRCVNAIFGDATNAAMKNTAAVGGGAIYLTNHSSFENVGIYYNESPKGAGVYYDGIGQAFNGYTPAGAHFENCVIRNNTTTNGRGGGIFCSWRTGSDPVYNQSYNDSQVFIKGTTTIDNNTAYYGGGVYVEEDGTVTMEAGNIHDNSTSTARSGGGVYVEEGTFNHDGGRIYSHTASTSGGGVFVDSDGIFNLDGGTVGVSGSSNTAPIGAGVFTQGTTNITSGYINFNTLSGSTKNGAGVYIAGGTTTMSGGYIQDHSATNGAGVYLNSGNFNLQGGYIGQNSHANAAVNGGGVYVNGGTFEMTGGNITYNTASTNGAGVYLNAGTFNFIGQGAIEHNTATVDGGGVYVNNSAFFTMKNCVLKLNTANQNGGGVYVNAGGVFTMWGEDLTHSCEVKSNTATGTGGGIYHKGTTIFLGLILVKDNTGGRATNNMYLDQTSGATYKYSHIHQNGLLCGSHIGIHNPTTGLKITEGLGTQGVTNAQYACRNEFFFGDSGLMVYTNNTGGYNTSSNSLYLYTVNTNSVFYNLSASSPTDYEISNGFITKVKTLAGLAYLAYEVNITGVDYQNHTVTLENDIVIPSGKIWEPIGRRTDCERMPFKGTFDGQFHVIYGVNSDPGYLDGGLFGYAVGATIKNVLMDSNHACSAAENLGGIVGFFDGGTLSQCEVRCTLTANSGCYTGGLIGKADNSVTVHSNYAIPTFTGSGNSGGLIGDSRARLFNCFVKTTTATYAFAVTNRLFIENCYVRGMGALLGSGTLVDFCYADHTLTSGSNNKDGVFGATSLINGKYGFNPVDQQITGGDANYVVNGGLGNNGRRGGLLATLNKYVDALNRAGSYTAWTRTMGSSINDDYPVLMFKGTVCVGSKDGEFLDYATDLNTMIQAYNNVLGGGDIYLYDVTSEVNQNTNSDVRVYINENIGVLQATGNRINARTGVTLDNSSSGFMAYDWHMFSSSLTAAPMGLVYRSGVADSYYVKNNYSTLLANGIPSTVFDDPNNMDPTKTEWSTSNIGYFPTNSPYGTWRGTADPTGSFDFYCYSEPYVHWINFKREGTPSFYDHWHMDADANGNHQNIPYENETTMEQGKGYMVALSKTSMLMADGVLNNGDASGNVTRNVTATDVSNILSYENNLKGVNLIGNPYHSYLKFDEFYNQNGINTYYVVDADAKKYVAYTVGQTAPEAPAKIHPHQGFFVMVDNSGSVTFTRRMRDTKGGAFRDDENPQYPLVNLNVADAQGRNDYATIELERPEAGGGEKAKGLHTGDASVWFHLDNIDWQTAFTVPGLHEAPVRFKAYADGVFTMTWEVLNTSFSYMHLIDNKTGMDVDCLRESEYRFEGKTTDYLSRFRLVFEFTGVEEEEEAVEAETFAFMMGDELLVNGGGVLQVFDLNGRCVYATELYDMQSTVTLPKMTSGIYVLRLTGNKSTRTQKMVIK